MEHPDLLFKLLIHLALIFVVLYILGINVATYIILGGRKNMSRLYKELETKYVAVINKTILTTDDKMYLDLTTGNMKLGNNIPMFLSYTSFISPSYTYWYFKFKKLFIQRTLHAGYHKESLI